jgi:hypothetical protein
MPVAQLDGRGCMLVVHAGPGVLVRRWISWQLAWPAVPRSGGCLLAITQGIHVPVLSACYSALH